MSKNEEEIEVEIKVSGVKSIGYQAIEKVSEKIPLTPEQAKRVGDLAVDELESLVHNPVYHLSMIIFWIGAFWGWCTAALGSASLFGIAPTIPSLEAIQTGTTSNISLVGNIIGYVMCFIGSLVLLGCGLLTKHIWRRTEGSSRAFKIFWAVSIIFYFFASFNGNAKYVILQNSLSSISDIFEQSTIFPLIAITVFAIGTTICPMLLSYSSKKRPNRKENSYSSN